MSSTVLTGFTAWQQMQYYLRWIVYLQIMYLVQMLRWCKHTMHCSTNAAINIATDNSPPVFHRLVMHFDMAVVVADRSLLRLAEWYQPMRLTVFSGSAAWGFDV